MNHERTLGDDDVVWPNGIERHVIDMILTVVADNAVEQERKRIAQEIRVMMERDGTKTGHAKAKQRAYRVVLDMVR